jgi:hypothetical protein
MREDGIVPESVRRDKLSDEKWLQAWVGKHPSKLKPLKPFEPSKTRDGKMAAAGDDKD